MAPASVRKLAARTVAALAREQAAINEAIHVLIKQHGTPVVRSSKGLGPVLQVTVLALLPELGYLDRWQIAKLVGVAPMNRDSGQGSGQCRRSPVRGGALYGHAVSGALGSADEGALPATA